MKYTSILIFILYNFIYAECYELNQADCLYWSYYCEWNEETSQCQEIGGGGGGGEADGPYDYQIITESDGLRNGPDYLDGRLYYPIDAEPPFKSIIFTPGYGGGSTSMADWAEYFASYGFTAMIIGPNDEINEWHIGRAEGLIDAITTIKQENERMASPLYGMIDSDSFIVSGYSMGGGASQIALTLDHPNVSSIKAGIALNPTIILEDCDLCPIDGGYCICLVPEMLDHDIPTFIVAGQFELNELPSYDGLLGQDIYDNTPETTVKMLFEVAGGGHGAAYETEPREKALQWAQYHLMGDVEICEALIEIPDTASDFQTTLNCEQQLPGDINGDTLINVQDVILAVNFVLSNQYDSNADLNSDGSVNVQDVVLILNLILD
ncbi:MAG: hypothetical protein CMG47_01705 [Candidatus Marinimicrobia bacterium]|nr:hypothetical protein [Candidatus Neomarinimicrobiota bacterium]|tara:strand:+ start:10281 stop:11420 length:1140 start_codon:yes stop_codon:yes gene_type:complete